MSAINYYVIDTETTGLKSNYHEINEISIIRCKDRVQIYRKIKCNYPERASIDALNITNKTLEDLENGHNPLQAIEDCEKFFNEDRLTPAHRCIIAHNASFDRKFLHAMWASFDKVFPANLWLDTIALTREYAKIIGLHKPKVNLQSACDIVGIKKVAGAHNAKVDSRNTYLLHKSLVEDKSINFLPFIKNEVHFIESNDEDIDMSIIEME